MKVLEPNDYLKVFMGSLEYDTTEKIEAYFLGKYNEHKECNPLSIYIDGLSKAYNNIKNAFEKFYNERLSNYFGVLDINPNSEIEKPDIYKLMLPLIWFDERFKGQFTLGMAESRYNCISQFGKSNFNKSKIINDMKTEPNFKLQNLNAENIEQFYQKQYYVWIFDNSDEVKVDGEILSKSDKLMYKLADFDIRPKPKEIIANCKKFGFDLTEQEFIEHEIKECKNLLTKNLGVDNSIKVKSYLKFLDERLIEITKPSTHSQPESLKGKQSFKTNLTKPQIKKLFKALFDNNFINKETIESDFKAVFSGDLPEGHNPIKWIDKSKKRHEPNAQTPFELLYLLKPYIEKKHYDTTASNEANFYRLIENCFADFKNLPEKNPSSAQSNTPRKTLLKTIVESL